MSSADKNLSKFEGSAIPDGTGMKIGILVSEWNIEITDALRKGAVQTLLENNVASVNIIEKRLGKENTKKIITEIENKNYNKAAEMLLIYYDKAYRLVMDKREKDSVRKQFLDSEDLNLNADQIIREASSIY